MKDDECWWRRARDREMSHRPGSSRRWEGIAPKALEGGGFASRQGGFAYIRKEQRKDG